MKTHSAQCKFRCVSTCLAVPWLLLFGISTNAFVLDNFNNKTGWTDTLNGGSATVAGGQFTIQTDNPSGSLTASIKTASPTTPAAGVLFTPVAGNTLELRVDVNTVLNASADTNALAILAWVPSGGAVGTDGYSLLVGANDIKIQKGAAVLYSTNGISLNLNNSTVVLRVTPSGGTVLVNGRVYKQATPGAAGLVSTLVFEQTATDISANLVGVAGNAALGVRNQDNPNGSVIAYDNLQVFDIINSVLDDFSSGNLNHWTSFTAYNGPPDVVTNSGGQVEFIGNPHQNGGFAGMIYKDKSFIIADGSRLEFTVDIVQNVGGTHSYCVLGFVPGTGANAIAALKGLIEYHIAVDLANVFNGKAFYGWWANSTVGYPGSNFRLIIDFTGEGTNCRIDARGEDLTKDINDPARIFYQGVAIDTPAQDIFEKDPRYSAAALGSVKYTPYSLFGAGSFAIDTFADDVITADVIMNNARVNQTIPPNLPPIVNNTAPALAANFVDTSSHITFDLVDEVNVVSNSIVLTLNGVAYTNGSPGVTVTPASGTAASRHFDLDGTGILASNTYYSGTIEAQDPQGASVSTPVAFDTFVTNSTFVVECEEYNFGTNGAPGTSPPTIGGLFFDNPELKPEGDVDPCCAYNGQTGAPEVDFHDNRGTGIGPGYDPDHSFRTEDVVQTARCTDPRRAKYILAGGAALNFNEQEVEDIRDGDWMNYSHHYPAGAYNVYLRQSQYKTPLSLVTLDEVTSDPTVGNQTAITRGSFIATGAGVSSFRDWLLTDGIGNPVVLKFDGSLRTFRLSERVTGAGSGGILEQNYMIFVPTANPGVLRPIISSASPLPGSATVPTGGNESSSPDTVATIANRDTSVDLTQPVTLTINGVLIPSAVVTPITGGATVAWSLTNLPGAASMTNTIIFQDTDGVQLTNSWTYSYAFVAASNALPVGTLSQRGWAYRMVQAADVGGAGNSLATAEQQLSIPPQIPYDVTYSTNGLQLLQWNNDTAVPNDVPGLSGVPGTPVPVDNIATETLGFIHLTAGGHRFFVNSDDGYQLRMGRTPSDTAATVVGARDGGTYNGTFDFVAEADALYPVRCIWYEHGGSAYFEMDTVNVGDGSHVLLNDPANPSGVVEVYLPYQITLLSSPTVNGPYTADPAGVVDQVAKTATVPITGPQKFIRLSGASSLKITSVSQLGSNLVLNYQFQ